MHGRMETHHVSSVTSDAVVIMDAAAKVITTLRKKLSHDIFLLGLLL